MHVLGVAVAVAVAVAVPVAVAVAVLESVCMAVGVAVRLAACVCVPCLWRARVAVSAAAVVAAAAVAGRWRQCVAVCVAMRRVSGTHIALLRLSAGQSGMMGNKHNPVSRVFGPITPVTNFSQSRGAVKPATLADSFVYLLFVCTGFSSGSSIALTAASPRSIFSGARRRATEAASAERTRAGPRKGR